MALYTAETKPSPSQMHHKHCGMAPFHSQPYSDHTTSGQFWLPHHQQHTCNVAVGDASICREGLHQRAIIIIMCFVSHGPCNSTPTTCIILALYASHHQRRRRNHVSGHQTTAFAMYMLDLFSSDTIWIETRALSCKMCCVCVIL